MNGELGVQRIDKWLWHARFVKTRSLAQKLVTSGKVRVDSEKITNAARKVSASNVLTITLERDVRIIEITGIPKRRGPYIEAQIYYTDLTPPKEIDDAKSISKENRPIHERSGRPTKQQRRRIIAMKHNSNHELD